MSNEISVSSTETKGPFSEEPADDIVALSKKLPLWQRDALRRIALHGALNDGDREILKSAMYAEHKLDNFSGELIPFKSDHYRVNAKKSPRGILCSIGPVQGINRLADGQQALRFAPNGITLVYGDNGSGKSGYIRISKKICRARTEEYLRGDAYAAVAKQPTAKIHWTMKGDDEKREFDWEPNKTPPPELSHISVFDTKHAGLFVDEKRKLTFMPFKVELFKRLADLITGFQNEVSQEIQHVEDVFSQIPDQTPDTRAAAIVNAISVATKVTELPSENELTTFCRWSDEDEKQLENAKLNIRQNSIVQADIRTRCIAALTRLNDELQTLEKELAEQRVQELERKFEAARIARAAAVVTAQESFADLPLKSVGSEAWRTLFKYAREFAGETYPGLDFPYIGDGAKCVLCHQPLDAAAKRRFERFDNFITGKAARAEEAKVAELASEAKTLNSLSIPKSEHVRERLTEYAGLSGKASQTVDGLVKFLEKVGRRRDAIMLAVTNGEFKEIGEPQRYSPHLLEQIESLRIEENRLRAETRDVEKQRAQAKELAELSGKKNLFENRVNIINNRDNRLKWIRLNACKDALSTTKVSNLVRKLREKYVTNELNSRIKSEIERLDLNHLHVSVKDHTQKGQSFFESNLGFNQAVKENSSVLSEGEQRGLALACFLAEASLHGDRHGMIFDDPVSSLDHQRIEGVAKRLVEEAKNNRQVIVFTHNIIFYQEVVKYAAEKQVPLIKNLIDRHPTKGAGIIEFDKEPYAARKVGDRISVIERNLAELKKSSTPTNSDKYRERVKNICDSLREAWERLVEEVLLNKTVERFGYDVKTQSLKGVIVDDKDYQTIHFAMTKLSKFTGHDQPAAKQGEIYKLDQLSEFVEEFKTYHKYIKARGQCLQKKRKELEKPPRPELL